MTPAIFIAIGSLICAILGVIAGFMLRVGTRLGESTAITAAAQRELKDTLDSFKSAFKELADWQDELQRKIHVLESQWQTAHRLIEKVHELDAEVRGMKAVCSERQGKSIRLVRHHEDGAVQPVGCPLEEAR